MDFGGQITSDALERLRSSAEDPAADLAHGDATQSRFAVRGGIDDGAWTGRETTIEVPEALSWRVLARTAVDGRTVSEIMIHPCELWLAGTERDDHVSGSDAAATWLSGWAENGVQIASEATHRRLVPNGERPYPAGMGPCMAAAPAHGSLPAG